MTKVLIFVLLLEFALTDVVYDKEEFFFKVATTSCLSPVEALSFYKIIIPLYR